VTKTPSPKSQAPKKHNLRSDDINSPLETKRVDTVTKTAVAPQTRILSEEIGALEYIIPSGVWARLEESPAKCVASMSTRGDKRCRNNRPSQSTDNIFRELSKCDIHVDADKFVKYVYQLVNATQCGSHRNVAYARIKKYLEEIAPNPFKLSKKDLVDFTLWIHAISIRDQPASYNSISLPVLPVKETRVRSKVLERKPVLSPSRSDRANRVTAPSSSLDFVPYLPKSTRYLDVPSALRKAISKPLGSKGLERGHIYVFWETGKFGKVKIGRTDNLERRLKEWNGKCGRPHEYHPASGRDLVEIRHVDRVERLMHLELKDYRMERYCEKCKVTHNEWFQVEEALVVQVFLKWKSWIEQEPYALDSDTGKWELRPDMEGSLKAVCQPVVLDKVKRTPPLLRADKKGKRVSRS
jgi:hypothetical protein